MEIGGWEWCKYLWVLILSTVNEDVYLIRWWRCFVAPWILSASWIDPQNMCELLEDGSGATLGIVGCEVVNS